MALSRSRPHTARIPRSGPRVSVGEIALTLAEKRVGAVQIVDDEDRVVGILTYDDVLRATGAEHLLRGARAKIVESAQR